MSLICSEVTLFPNIPKSKSRSFLIKFLSLIIPSNVPNSGQISIPSDLNKEITSSNICFALLLKVVVRFLFLIFQI